MNEEDAAARTLGLGRRAVAENRGWTRGQGLAGGRAGGGERDLDGGGGAGAGVVEARRGSASVAEARRGSAGATEARRGRGRLRGRGGGLRQAAVASSWRARARWRRVVWHG
jgi:hypothetical protein